LSGTDPESTLEGLGFLWKLWKLWKAFQSKTSFADGVTQQSKARIILA
jgi:hypothetical protein